MPVGYAGQRLPKRSRSTTAHIGGIKVVCISVCHEVGNLVLLVGEVGVDVADGVVLAVLLVHHVLSIRVYRGCIPGEGLYDVVVAVETWFFALVRIGAGLKECIY